MLAYLVAAVVVAMPIQPVGFAAPSRAPIVYRLAGYLDTAPAGATVYFKAVIGYGSRDRNYLVTNYTRSGDGNPFDLFRNLGMFKPDFILIGPAKPLDAIIEAPAGSQVSGTFYYRPSNHVLEVDPHALKIE